LENRFTTILSEVEKARKGLAACLLAFLALTATVFFFSERTLRELSRLPGRKLVAYSLEEGFLALASLSVSCAFVLTLPLAGVLLWRGAILPRVPSLKGWGVPIFAAAVSLFLCGALLGYFVLLPAGIGFLAGFENQEISALLSARKFVSFCCGLLIALGLAFEMPLLSFFLARLGWLSPEFFRKRWRHALIACAVLSAVITPTADVFNMLLLTAPLLALYFVSFLVVAAAGRPKTE